MNEHKKLLSLARHHMIGISHNDEYLNYHIHKFNLVCQLLADLGEVRYRRGALDER